jgi:mono/diheme cytochrome c family protein
MARLPAVVALLGLAFAVTTSAQAPRSVWDGVYSEGQALSGALSSGLCAQCHGDSLRGDPAPPLVGPEFIDRWNGATLGELFDYVIKTMPDDDPGALRPRQYAELIAYVLRANGFPAGATDLPTDLDTLNQIRLDAARSDRRE